MRRLIARLCRSIACKIGETIVPVSFYRSIRQFSLKGAGNEASQLLII